MANLSTYSSYLSFYTVWLLLIFLVFVFIFDILDYPYFSFGPNYNLYIIGLGLHINTWPKYCFLSLFLIVDNIIYIFMSDTIFPWSNSSILNEDKEEIHQNKIGSFIVINWAYLLFSLKGILSIGMSITQVDLFLYTQIGGMISGIITTAKAIKKKKYPKSEIELENMV